MATLINHAILHILNNDGTQSIFSDEELDIDSEICCEYVKKHIRRLLSSPAAKTATFNADSNVYGMMGQLLKGEIWFKDFSKQLCELLEEIIHKSSEIPSSDVLVTQFTHNRGEYLGIFKLNYKECYTHKTDSKEGGADNQIIKYHAVLPFDGGKLEEACVIPYEPMIIRLIEKEYPIDGESVPYFSKLFLECETEISKKEAVEAISDATEDISSKFFNSSPETIAKINTAILDEAEESEGVVDIEKVAANVFGNQLEIKDEYIEKVRDAGIRSELDLGAGFVRSKFGKQVFKAENGIEIKFPAELTEDANAIEFNEHGDGSVTITLKSLRRKE